MTQDETRAPEAGTRRDSKSGVGRALPKMATARPVFPSGPAGGSPNRIESRMGGVTGHNNTTGRDDDELLSSWRILVPPFP